MRFLVGFLLLVVSANAQDYRINSWKSHLPLNQGLGVVQSENIVFHASKGGLILLDKNSEEKSVLTKAEGLLDTDLSCVFYNSLNDNLIIGYESGGIDIYNNGGITSYLGIINSSVLGSKRINRIREINGTIYLCTAFGIVVFDDNKVEVKDTYYLKENNLAINDIRLYNSMFYAATENGVYTAGNDLILSNYMNWAKEDLAVSVENFSEFFSLNEALYVNNNAGNYYADSVYKNVNGEWLLVPELTGSRFKSFYVKSDEQLYVSNDFGISIYDTLFNKIKYIYEYTPEVGMKPIQIIPDIEREDVIWCSDKTLGLVKNRNTWYTTFYDYQNPKTKNVFKLQAAHNNMYMTSGGASGSLWQNVWLQDGVSYYDGLDWKVINKATTSDLDSIFDMVDIAVDPSNENHFFVSTLGDGVVEILNGQVVNIHADQNSTLQPVYPISPAWYWIGVTGVEYDNNGNLWCLNLGAENILSVMDTEGNWYSIDVRNTTSSSQTGDIIATSNNQIWAMLPSSNQVLIYDAKGTIDDFSDDSDTLLTSSYGLPGNVVNCMTEDLDGEIWIGTDKGIAVVYNPRNIFDGGVLEAKQILIDQNGFTEYLFENNTITTIAVDGANRKWVGTLNSGVFLIAEDGSSELSSFNKDNSPLPSNSIKSIAINHETGEVFFGTDGGVVSFRSEATIGTNKNTNVKVYPNPVRENYRGPIAIKGLANNSNVKITDVAGNLVYETDSFGSQAIWYGNDLMGKRVSSGVYLVFASSDNGQERFATKILLIN